MKLQVYSARNIQTEKIVTGEDLANAIIGPPAVYIPDLVKFLTVILCMNWSTLKSNTFALSCFNTSICSTAVCV